MKRRGGSREARGRFAGRRDGDSSNVATTKRPRRESPGAVSVGAIIKRHHSARSCPEEFDPQAVGSNLFAHASPTVLAAVQCLDPQAVAADDAQRNVPARDPLRGSDRRSKRWRRRLTDGSQVPSSYLTAIVDHLRLRFLEVVPDIATAQSADDRRRRSAVAGSEQAPDTAADEPAGDHAEGTRIALLCNDLTNRLDRRRPRRADAVPLGKRGRHRHQQSRERDKRRDDPPGQDTAVLDFHRC